MSDAVDIKALAKLARLEVSDAEVAKLETEVPGILAFVETIQKVQVSVVATEDSLRNVVRPDDNAYEGGKYTEILLNAAPAREGNRIAVKQVISRKK
ncbi:aspartyl/glutamyl-tRNA amidotransferase subunit C [Candidatus Kaiserbacteria bacterium]|nr:aspartyl/glutamyl-tRNA amidotransferase subunit C [Candidatus Kaiserbacteria bacterium]